MTKLSIYASVGGALFGFVIALGIVGYLLGLTPAAATVFSWLAIPATAVLTAKRGA